MKYTMRAGVLYACETPVMRIKGAFAGPEKKIISEDGEILLRTIIRSLEAPPEMRGNAHFREYIMLDGNEKEYAAAKPGYAEGEEQAAAGWPVCRMPRVDHAGLLVEDKEYLLIMQNSQNYSLKTLSGESVMQIFHRGLAGGWNIEAADDLAPELICGIFVFCRYLEQENEFLIV